MIETKIKKFLVELELGIIREWEGEFDAFSRLKREQCGDSLKEQLLKRCLEVIELEPGDDGYCYDNVRSLLAMSELELLHTVLLCTYDDEAVFYSGATYEDVSEMLRQQYCSEIVLEKGLCCFYDSDIPERTAEPLERVLYRFKEAYEFVCENLTCIAIKSANEPISCIGSGMDMAVAGDVLQKYAQYVATHSENEVVELQMFMSTVGECFFELMDGLRPHYIYDSATNTIEKTIRTELYALTLDEFRNLKVGETVYAINGDSFTITNNVDDSMVAFTSRRDVFLPGNLYKRKGGA